MPAVNGPAADADLDTLLADIDAARSQGLAAIAAASSTDELAQVESGLFGRKSALGPIKQGLGSLPPAAASRSRAGAQRGAAGIAVGACGSSRRAGRRGTP